LVEIEKVKFWCRTRSLNEYQAKCCSQSQKGRYVKRKPTEKQEESTEIGRLATATLPDHPISSLQ
jgi:hypothetical protein